MLWCCYLCVKLTSFFQQPQLCESPALGVGCGKKKQERACSPQLAVKASKSCTSTIDKRSRAVSAAMTRFTAGNNADPDRLSRIMNAKQRLIGVSAWWKQDSVLDLETTI